MYYMQAIRTKFIRATNHKGCKIVAQCAVKKIVIAYDYSLNIDENHYKAAHKLINILGWTPDKGSYTEFVSGVYNEDYYWVQK